MIVAFTCCPVFQLNISFPATGCQKLIEVDDERKLRTFYEKRMATEVAADPLGDEWKVRCFLFLKELRGFQSWFQLPGSICVVKQTERGTQQTLSD